jgi:lipoate-protein ligase B
MIKENTLCQVKDLGIIDYSKAYALQRDYVNILVQGGAQTLLLCEHPPTLTLGRSTDEKHLLASQAELEERSVRVHQIDRGGDITLHAPGQLVVYPILDLANFGKDLRSYLNQLEQVVIDLLSEFGIVANRFLGQTGVWAGTKKIASIGIGVRKWVSFHGLAVNVNTDLKLFSMIKPCGLDVEMTSISNIKSEEIDMYAVKERIVSSFCENFVLSI